MSSLRRTLGSGLRAEVALLRGPAHEYLAEMLSIRERLAAARSDEERHRLLLDAEAAEVAFALKLREAERARRRRGGEGHDDDKT